MLEAYDLQFRATAAGRRHNRLNGVLRLALVASLVLVVLVLSTVPSVAASVPGEFFYPVKQLYEQVELAAAVSPDAKANVYLQHADRRVQEALVLLGRNQFSTSLVTNALSDITAAREESNVDTSVNFWGQLRQLETALDFILEGATTTQLISEAEAAPLSAQVEAISDDGFPTPSPSATVEQTVFPLPSATSTGRASATPEPNSTLPAPGLSPTCGPQDRSCRVGNIPNEGQAQATVRTTHTPRPSHTERPMLTPRATNTPIPTNTPRPTSLPPTAASTPGGSNPNANNNPNSNAGGNGNGNSNSNAGSNNSGNSNAGGNGNGGGKGNGK
jgi:uncharacterized membrane protein YgcG